MKSVESEVAIATIKPVVDKWIKKSPNPEKSRKDWSNYKNKIREDGRSDLVLRHEIPFLLAEQIQSANSVSSGDPELEDKYIKLVQRFDTYKKDKRDEIDKLINENKELRCKVSTLEFDNNINRKKLDNIMKDWVDNGGDLDEYLNMVDKGVNEQFETESAILLKKENDDDYKYWTSDEETNQ